MVLALAHSRRPWTLMTSLSQAAARADVTTQTCVSLLLILSELCTLQEVHLIQVLVIALLVCLQLIINLRSYLTSPTGSMNRYSQPIAPACPARITVHCTQTSIFLGQRFVAFLLTPLRFLPLIAHPSLWL